MSEPVVAQKSPYSAQVEAGKSYWWCACGQSKNQPFCDGSHKGGSFVPREYKADASKTVWFCGCKHSKAAPLCDGSHNTL
jgi:CDGSH-type Zn-finger protein